MSLDLGLAWHDPRGESSKAGDDRGNRDCYSHDYTQKGLVSQIDARAWRMMSLANSCLYHFGRGCIASPRMLGHVVDYAGPYQHPICGLCPSEVCLEKT